MALEIFSFQRAHNAVYQAFLAKLGRSNPQHWTEIPHMPIAMFKQHRILSTSTDVEQIFTSSGTTGIVTAQHFVTSLNAYRSSFMRQFTTVYGSPEDYCIIGLLPAYLERPGSSLVYMVQHLIEASGHEKSGTYLYEHEQLAKVLAELKSAGQKCILFGVTFALLDFIEQGHGLDFPELIIIETGGMKGRRKEMIREELHSILMEGFNVPAIHGEYGMTELLSQAYSKGEGRYTPPAWMGISIRDIHDPFAQRKSGQSGGVNITDLANVHSCAFIATDDLGRKFEDGTFEILGRFDHSDTRGCSLLI